MLLLIQEIVYYLEKKLAHSKAFSTEKIVRIFKLGPELQSFVYNNGMTFKISILIVGLIQRVFLGRKVTLRTLCTCEQHLQTTFMEWFCRCTMVWH